MNVFEAEILWRTEMKLRKKPCRHANTVTGYYTNITFTDRNLHIPTRCLIDRSEYVGDLYHEWIKFIRPSLTSSRHFSDSLDSSFQFSRIYDRIGRDIFFLGATMSSFDRACIDRVYLYFFFLLLLSEKRKKTRDNFRLNFSNLFIYSVDWTYKFVWKNRRTRSK